VGGGGGSGASKDRGGCDRGEPSAPAETGILVERISHAHVGSPCSVEPLANRFALHRLQPLAFCARPGSHRCHFYRFRQEFVVGLPAKGQRVDGIWPPPRSPRENNNARQDGSLCK